MSFETELPSIAIQSIASVVAILIIGWKIREALCRQITQLRIDLDVHKGISEPIKKELEGKITRLHARLDKIVYENNLKV